MNISLKAPHPNKLLNALLAHFNLDVDYKLALVLGFSMSNMSRIRQGKVALSANMILAIYDKTGWSIERIRNLAGFGAKEVVGLEIANAPAMFKPQVDVRRKNE